MKLNRGAALVLSAVAALSGIVRPHDCAAGVVMQDSTPRPLPTPGGNMSVGTTVIQLVDSARSARELTVQLWYPRTPNKSLTSAPYFPDPRTLEALVGSTPDSALVRSWSRVETSAFLDVDVMALPWKLPLVFFSAAQGLPRSSYTALLQDVASFGNIVAAIDAVAIDADTSTEARAQVAAVRAADAAFVLTALRRFKDVKNAPVILKHAATLADWDKVGMFGHEAGGTAALEACRRDKRFKACVSLDGELADETGITRPALIIRSDAKIASGATEKALAAKQDVPAFIGTVTGFNRWSFTDYPFVYPQAVLRVGGRVIGAQRSFIITSEFVRAFFACHLQGKPSELLRAGKSEVPEVTLNALTSATRKPCIPVR